MSRSKRLGTSWESAVVAYLQEHGWPHAERRVLHGALDKGDVTGIPGLVVECKNTAKIELAEFLDEAEWEKRNARAAVGVAWIKRRGKASAGEGYVLMTGLQFTELLREAGY